MEVVMFGVYVVSGGTAGAGGVLLENLCLSESNQVVNESSVEPKNIKKHRTMLSSDSNSVSSVSVVLRQAWMCWVYGLELYSPEPVHLLTRSSTVTCG